MIGASVLMLVAVVVAVVVVATGRSSHRVAAAATAAADTFHLGADGTELATRWARRAHRWRRTAATPVFAVSCVAAVRFTGQLQLGLLDTAGRVPLLADPVLATLLAVALGAFAAELHHLRPAFDGPRTAELVPRDVRALRRPGSVARQVALGVLAVAAMGLHVWLVPPGGGAGSPAAVAVAACLLVGAELTQRRIAGRPRPALSTDLAAADDLVRTAAVRSVDDAASGAALLLVAWACLGLADHAPATDVTSVLVPVGSITALATSVYWAARSRPSRLLRVAATRAQRVTA